MWKVIKKFPVEDKEKKIYIRKSVYFLFGIPIWFSIDISEISSLNTALDLAKNTIS